MKREEISAKVIAAELLHKNNSMDYSLGMFVSNYMETVMNDSLPLGFSR